MAVTSVFLIVISSIVIPPLFLLRLIRIQDISWLAIGLIQGGMGLIVFTLQELGLVTIPDGVTLPAFSVLTFAGILLIIAAHPLKLKMFFSPMSLFVTLFTLIVIAGVFYSWHNGAEDKALKYVAANFIPFAGALLLSYSQRKKLYGLTLIIAIIFSIGVIYNFFFSGEGAGRGRYGTFGIDTINTARLIGLGFMIMIAGNSGLKFRTPLMLVAIAGLLLAASRGPILAVIFAVVAISLLKQAHLIPRQLRRSRSLFFLVLAIIVVTFGLFLLVRFLPPAILAENWGPLRLINETNFVDENITSRFEGWGTALRDFGTSPIIGMGTSGFSGSLATSNPDSLTYPHNIFLEVISEWGIVGASVFLLMLCRFVLNIQLLLRLSTKYSQVRFQEETLLLTGLFVFSVMAASFSGQLFTSRFIWVILGLSEIMRFELIRKISSQRSSYNAM